MGFLENGQWQDDDGKWASQDGKFHRSVSQFRSCIGEPLFPPERNRYHLYVSLACPWAHRTLIMRRLKGLEEIIPISIVHPHMLDSGWEFKPESEPLYGFTYAHQLYAKADPGYTGRVSVPILWDKKSETIVCNESAEIIRMFNSAFDDLAFDDLTGNRENYYPEDLRDEIDKINAFVYDSINNGVYKCGFATTQDAYEEAFDALFAALDAVEARLKGHEFLVDGRLTEADIRLYTTLVRFDPVYFSHFKCNRNRIMDMPNLWAYLKRLWCIPAFRETTDFEHIKQHYFYSHASINPTRIVPRGPELHLEESNA